MENLNQVLLHKTVRTGADLEGWLEEAGGGIGLRVAIDAPDSVIPMLKEAGLRGLGGSGFPTHVKWNMVAQQSNRREKYLVCNGNEDEPGTFKDALLLEETPHQVIEGALIAAVATKINRVVFYINPDLKGAIAVMRHAVKQWEDAELYFDASKAIGQPLVLSVLPSSGHYIGGEETAVIETVENKFPFPRPKPPFPAEQGVHGYPTLINNVETLSNVSHIAKNGPEWFQNLGIGEARGTKIYSLSGDVLSPGVYELPMGTPLSELINTYGGGMLVNKKFKAVFTGGPSNTILTPQDLEVALDFDSVAARNSSLGTGAMIVISEGTGIVKRVAEYVNFFAHSSCGQCPPCKTGTYYIAMLLDKIDTGRGRKADLEQLIELCKILPGSGRCALISGAVKVVESSLSHFRAEYERALKD
ncbi:MAG: NADH-quinone oxidoreductase subunit F [Gammaproteobacteria bacterium]|nr:NADH-quinone oxidoreductase subunit F [Gammaproteobacteria bacterium]